MDKFKDQDLEIYYVVLYIGKEELLSRINKRGEENPLIDRSLILLSKLTNSPQNRKYLLDTTNKSTSNIVDKIIENKRFKL